MILRSSYWSVCSLFALLAAPAAAAIDPRAPAKLDPAAGAARPCTVDEQHAQVGAPAAPRGHVAWDARAVEHLLNRAGFGARPSEIQDGVKLGQAALVEKLVTQRADVEPFFIDDIQIPDGPELKDLSKEERQKKIQEYREKDRKQMLDYVGWWFDRMASGEDPLREKMVLFWHGFFTTSAEDVKRGVEVLRQNQFVREHALGSYADLLSGIARDPAMLVYLNNNVNRKGNPNENLAREIMELFSLGVGNYSEKDIKEAARALTGRGVSKDGEYEFHPNQHDTGEKTVLGSTGKLDGDDLVKILLHQDACSAYVARKLITWFEGVEPKPERLKEYASFLHAQNYQLQPFLRKLFMDPAFYRDEIVGARVQSPVEYMVGTSRRLGMRTPAVILGSGAALLGQRLFAPPSVKGWDEGEAWITTASLMQRGNMAGMMLGVVKLDDVFSQNDLEEAAPRTRSDDDDRMMRGDDDKNAPKDGDKKDARADGDKKDARPDGGGKGDTKDGDGDKTTPAKRPVRPANKRGGSGFAYQALRRVEATGWRPALNFSARMMKDNANTDAEIVDRMLDDLLAIQAPSDTRDKMRDFLAKERTRLKEPDGHLLDAGTEAEHVLRRLAHLILSLPEAQLE
jgi:uncharacterized protein (DUF1800 family)